MVNGLIWIAGVYGFCIMLVHGVHRLQPKLLAQKKTAKVNNKTVHAALITLNNQLQIEWYLRSFLWLSALRGRTIYVTVFDAGSMDDTLAIATKLALTRDNIHVETSTAGVPQFMSQHKDDAVIVLQLMNRTAQDGCIIPHL